MVCLYWRGEKIPSINYFFWGGCFTTRGNVRGNNDKQSKKRSRYQLMNVLIAILFCLVVIGTYSWVCLPLFVTFTPVDTKTRPSVANIWRGLSGL